jgi:hypothetical protein
LLLLIYKPKQVDVNSADLTINGVVNEKLLSAAVAEYGAEIRKNKEKRNSQASGRVLHNALK